MSETELSKKPDFVGQPLQIRELTEVLIRHYRLTEGRYSLAIGFRIGTGAFGPDEDRLPGTVVAVSEVSLVRAEEGDVLSVDAATLSKPPIAKRAKAIKAEEKR